MMRFGAVKAIVTMPYSGGDRSLAASITPIAEMSVEAAKAPQKVEAALS